MYRDFRLANSFTLESSCHGYKVHKDPYQIDKGHVVQFTREHLLRFGKSLAMGVGKHLESKRERVEV